jgi:carboxyl-terminal processing protease
MVRLKQLHWFFLIFFFFVFSNEATLPPDINNKDVLKKVEEMMKAHAAQKELSPELAKRIITNYIDHLDPTKTYFIESDIINEINPTEELLNHLISKYNEGDFDFFQQIQKQLIKAINRRRAIDEKIDFNHLPSNVKADEFKEMKWVKSEEELIERLKRIRSLQLETASKLKEEDREKAIQRIGKAQKKYEDEMLVIDQKICDQQIYANILKATASALDAHSVYFTPEEAKQFMIQVQQKLCGIGAQLRDDLNGFTVVKNVEGGPAALSKELKAKDRIIAVNDEPVVGMEINDAVQLIRGAANTPVKLTVIRTHQKEDGLVEEEKLDLTILRGEVVLKEFRYKASFEPFGSGVIGYVKLYSFYQDRESSSAEDLAREIKKLKQDHKVNGLVLDLRFNSGGLLPQAVAVTGLFINKGIVVSIKNESQKIQHLRNPGGNLAWDGPLIVLVNRMSASASEIVAQTLQDYGRAIIVGDEHTFGKGSYQTFTLTTDDETKVNPQGEFKVTRGRYYTVSGKTPQLIGVHSDIVVKGVLSETDVGEKFAKFPLENDSIQPGFEDDFTDIPVFHRDKIKKQFKYNVQKKLDVYIPYIETLKKNSSERLARSVNYQNFLKELKKKEWKETELENFGQNDLQLEEANAIMKDLILMMKENNQAQKSVQLESFNYSTNKQK